MNGSPISATSVCGAVERCTGVALVVFSRQGRLIRWSAAAQKLTGWSDADALDKPLSWWLGDETATLEAWSARLGTAGWSSVNVEHPRSDGSSFACRSLVSLVKESDEVSGLVELVGGGDGLRQESSALEEQERLLHAQKLESLGVMAGGIAHDFNNILTAVLGNASLVLRDLPFGHTARPLVQSIQDAARRAARLTRELLAYSGRAKFEIRPIDLSAHVRDISHLVRSCISKKANLCLELAEGLPSVEADVAQLQQIVMNLVVNASEAIGDSPGTICVRTGMLRQREDPLRRLIGNQTLPDGECVFLEVSDTGSGIPEAIRARIFEPFFTTKFQGRGLGLSAALGIMRAHKGALGLESSPGSGTRFTAYFPTVSSPPHFTSKTAPVQFRGSGTVLVVDDEESVRSVASIVLRELGFAVVEAVNGLEAVSLLSQRPREFRAVLLDMAMPVMDGPEAFARIRAVRPDIPIVVTSGYTESDAATRFGPDQPSGFLNKPYTAAQCAEAFMAALELPSPPTGATP